jgi:prealbumin domain-containing protein
MGRNRRAAVASVLLATCLFFIYQTNSRLSAAPSSITLAQARAWVAKAIEPASSRIPVLRRIAAPVRLAQSSGGSGTVEPWVTTDKDDYKPGDVAQISGGGFVGDETVWLQVVHSDPNATITDPDHHLPWPVGINPDGTFASTWSIDLNDAQGQEFILTATGSPSGRIAETRFTDNASANLDQCQNGADLATSNSGCNTDATDWVNGNLGSSKSVYFEGDSIPYRMRFGDLSLDNSSTTTVDEGEHAVTIKWDTTKSGKHAIDYLTTYNRTVLNANPCLGVSGCNFAVFNTRAIPKDPQVDTSLGGPITQLDGVFTLFGGTILGVDTPYVYPDGAGFVGDKSAQLTIHFHANVANPVLAWGGHIATRQDWGNDGSAVAIPGSPYHMALAGSHNGVGGLDGQGGAQDRSLSAAAVIFPGSITIIKDAEPNGSTSFPFTASPAPLSNFSLVDDGTSANTKVFSNITNFQTYTVQEGTVTGWGLNSITCTLTSPNSPPGSATPNLGTRTVTIDMKEGENYSCTFVNAVQRVTLTVIKHVINDNGGTASASDFTMSVSGGNPSPANSAGAESPGTPVGIDPNAPYNVTESGPSGYTASYSAGCTSATGIPVGGSATCTITNDDNAATLIVIKHVINDNGGTKVAADFTLDSGGANDTPDNFAGAESPGTTVTLDAGSYTVSETGPSGYTASYSADCAGSIANGETKTCTVTNDDQAAQLIVIKHVINDNGGSATAANFTLDSGGANDTPDNFAGAESPGTTVTLDAGSYNVTETGPSGYAASFSADCSGTIANGQTKTCTVTNDDVAAKLIVIKHVINDNGGTATAANFTMSVTGNSPSPASFAGAESPGTDVAISPGSYSVGETGPSGYAASFSAYCSGSIALGQTKTCTVTNDDIAPILRLRKAVVNDNGGTAAVTAWTLTANGTGTNDMSGATPLDSGPGLKADTWTLSESSVYGYSLASLVCVGGTQNVNTITLGVGQQATCTFTNDDQPGRIVITKNAKPQSGVFTFTSTGSTSGPGTAWPSGFTLTGSTSGGGNTRTFLVDAGHYETTESSQIGWLLTGIGGDTTTPLSCVISGSGGSTGVGDLALQKVTIDIKIGDTVTCIFENTGQGVTRTQGFWATHTKLAGPAWFGGTSETYPTHTFPGVSSTPGILNKTLCSPVTKDITTLGRLMGGFWSDISKKSTGVKRQAIDQTRMQLLQQLLAAELNASAFGADPGTGKFDQWEAAYCTGTTTQIKNALQEAASFNTAGDSGTFTPGTSADSKYARSVADIPFWDPLP